VSLRKEVGVRADELDRTNGDGGGADALADFCVSWRLNEKLEDVE
jgi:hypothetical protein